MSAELWQAHLLSLLATVYSAAGQREQALAVLTQSLDRLAKTGEQESATELYRLKGEMLIQAGASDAVDEAE